MQWTGRPPGKSALKFSHAVDRWMTLAPVAVEVTPHPEILYQEADPKGGSKTRLVLAGVVSSMLPLLFGLVIFLQYSPSTDAERMTQGLSYAVFGGVLLLMGSTAVLAAWALAKPSPPPAITKDGVLVYSWIPFLARSPVEHRFDAYRTVKGYRVRQYTVIELHVPNLKRRNVEVFDPDGRALQIVREAVLKSQTPLAEGRA